jgi:hypothetical protein
MRTFPSVRGFQVAKKTANISTVRATPEEREEFKKLVQRLGFSSMAHFFRQAMETLIKQTALGEDLVWPLRFEKRKRASENKRR